MFNTLLVKPLFNLLAIIYAYLPGHDFGVAIIILTIIIRLILWPVVTKQLHSQRAMQQLQPELARIKAEAKGDRALESKLTMELYKEKEINPLGSLLPLLIQLPIFIALYAVLRDLVKPGEIEHLAYPAVKNLAPIAAIIASNSPFHPQLFGVIDLAKPSPILAVLAGVFQFIQTKQLAPKNAVKDASAQVTAAMTYAFPFVTFILGLTFPAALTLYWTTSSAVAVLQQTIVLRRDARELAVIEEAIVLDAPTPAKLNSPKKKKAKKK
ncbi:membrane protein insertase YidC [Candidatus Saccharibacteria bacterium]|nr:membrane protein insertase YidC [Candidatus Saccharibacteria bacterium]